MLAHVLDYELDWLLFEHYFNLCSIFVPEFLLIHRNRIFVTSFVDGMVSLCLHLVSCLSTWDGLFKFHTHIAMFTQIDSCEPAPNPGSLGLPRESCYTRTQSSSYFHSCFLPISCLSHTWYWLPHSHPIPTPTHSVLLPSTYDSIALSKWNSAILSWAFLPSNLTSCTLGVYHGYIAVYD